MARRRRGRSEGAIFQRKAGMWVGAVSLGYDDKGKRRRKTVYGKSKSEVQEKLRELQTAADRGALPEAGSLTVAQYLRAWLETVRPTVAPHTHLPSMSSSR